MADKNFFDLLKAKIAEFKPSKKHQSSDWTALQDRLQTALPHQPGERRRAIVLPFLLLTAFLSSNAVWWQSSRNDRAAMAQLATQVADLQASIQVRDATPSVRVRVDTVWKTLYVAQLNSIPRISAEVLPELNSKPTLARPKAARISMESSFALETQSTTTEIPAANETVLHADHPDSTKQWTDLTTLKLSPVAFLQSDKSAILAPKTLIVNPLETGKTTEPFGQNLLKFLHPKFFKVGISAGWLYANSSDLMHEGGFSSNLLGEIGLSRHWSITAAFNMGRVHYKSHAQEAILGAPELPMLPSMDHHFSEMDVSGQKIRQFDLGLRYTFAQPGKPRPFLGIAWGGQTLLPFTIEYEIQHEPSGMIEKGVFEVTNRTKMRNIFGLSGGFQIPISSRIDLNMEGFYQRQWKKSNKQAPDLAGIRAGLSWLF